MSDTRERLLDELIVLRCQEGHRPSFAALVERWQPRLLRHARRLVGREDAALDVVQETWLVVARGVGALRDPLRLRGWLYGIVTRCAADWQRRRARDATEELDADPRDDDEVPSESIDDVRRALRRLPRERRALLSLRYVDELDLAEIAEALGVPVGTVGSRLHHARAELRALLERTER